MRVICSLSISLMLATALSAQAPSFETTRIADGVYQFRWQTHNSFFVTSPEGVVVVDPISTDAARQLSREIRRVAPNVPLRAIVYSHSDADHATGAGVLRAEFGEQVPIVAHANAVDDIEATGSDDLPVPDITFHQRGAVSFGGRTLELHYLGNSHSDNMIVALLPDERVAFAVDFVSNDRVGFRDLPGWHFPDFFAALERLRGLGFETIVFGHGPPGDRASIDRQVQYYTDLRRAVTEAVEAGLSEDEAAARVTLPDYSGWGRYDDWLELNVRGVYRWMAGGR